MAYYSDEDRKQAANEFLADIRKLNSLLRQAVKRKQNSSEDYFDILGRKVPLVSRIPTLDEYGLPNDIEKRLKLADEEYIRTKKSKRKTIALIITAAIIGLYIFVIGQSNQTTHPENYYNGHLVNGIIKFCWDILPIGGFIGFPALWIWAFSVTPKETYEHTQYKEYKEQLRYYEYWQRKKSKDYWNNLSGHAFENAVANLFRNIGFTAEVSSGGGDGGVDIVLHKAHRRIVVQCKRYKNTVSPHVIRDLWGTMKNIGVNEGCIVTTTGFTKGVTSFAEGKAIFLIDLNDILRSTAEDGATYLRRKIGERI